MSQFISERATDRIKRQLPLHLMLLPGIILVLIFHYYPMIGIIIAFEDYNPTKGFFGSQIVGFKNFIYVFSMPDTFRVLWNTVFISFMKIVAGLIVPLVYAILLDLVRRSFIRRTIQTIVYIPNFLSWVILSGILVDILSPVDGIVNIFLRTVGVEPVFFLANEKFFPFILVITDVWKNFGYGTVIYIAAITSIDPMLYEASIIDGANRFKQVWHITIPGILPIVILMGTLSLGNILNAGFEQVFNLYSPIVYSTGDILDTFVYRIGLLNNQYGFGTAVGLLKSVVSFIFISVGYKLAYKFADYRVF